MCKSMGFAVNSSVAAQHSVLECKQSHCMSVSCATKWAFKLRAAIAVHR